jgi:NDP-sugar pyrophosphorylase family protein
MQIIIPMSGFGERFRAAGYSVPKPLIEVEGKPIISHVIDMFPGESDFIFICNQDHLDEPSYRMEEILRNLCPTGKVLGIAAHKLGPVHAVLQAESLILDDKPTIVNYCDFTCYWDWRHFKEFVRDNQCLGAIPSYKGFHPHTLGSTNYAYMLETDGWVVDIQEKQPYTDNRMDEFASSGTYYFSSGAVMKESFRQQVEHGFDLNGEFYVSLAYKLLLQNNARVAIYPLQHFMQWGTPEDVAEYNYWSEAFRKLLSSNSDNGLSFGTIVMPMAGLGQRFLNAGYEQTKPLIKVSGQPMVLQAVADLPSSKELVFILRSDMHEYYPVMRALSSSYPQSMVRVIDGITEGQACTALLGLEYARGKDKLLDPVTIGACDNGAIYNENKLNELMNDMSVDVVVWGVRGYANAVRNPKMYGWIDVDEKDVIKSISVKSPLENKENDPIVIGTFTFRKQSDYVKSLEHLIERGGRVNGEFYIDELINDAIQLGLKCMLFEVDSYLCWGTPNDLKTFEYWQSCFHKWDGHPYRLQLDPRVSEAEVENLNKKFMGTAD